jgi:hypothetical protein
MNTTQVTTTAEKTTFNRQPTRGTSDQKNPKNKKPQAVVTPRASIDAVLQQPFARNKRYSDPLMDSENESERSAKEEETDESDDEADIKKRSKRGTRIAAASQEAASNKKAGASKKAAASKKSCSEEEEEEEEEEYGRNEDDQSRTSIVSAAFNNTSPMSTTTASLGYRLKVSEERNRQYEERVRELESQLRTMQGVKKKYTKKELAQHYEWDETDVSLGNNMMNVCKKYLFPRYKFLGDNWTEYDPRPNSLSTNVFDIIRSAIPAEENPAGVWNRVLAPAISKKYADLRCNINNQCRMAFLGKYNDCVFY